MLAIGVLALILLALLYKRVIPVLGVPFEKRIQVSGAAVVDIRDYNVSSKHPVPESINIPVAYLNRSFQEIPGKQVHVVAGGMVEKNIGIRMLKQKGFQVVSYTIIETDYKKSGKKKRRVNFELRQSCKESCKTD